MQKYGKTWKVLVDSRDKAPARYIEPGPHPEAAERNRSCERNRSQSARTGFVSGSETALLLMWKGVRVGWSRDLCDFPAHRAPCTLQWGLLHLGRTG